MKREIIVRLERSPGSKVESRRPRFLGVRCAVCGVRGGASPSTEHRAPNTRTPLLAGDSPFPDHCPNEKTILIVLCEATGPDRPRAGRYFHRCTAATATSETPRGRPRSTVTCVTWPVSL